MSELLRYIRVGTRMDQDAKGHWVTYKSARNRIEALEQQLAAVDETLDAWEQTAKRFAEQGQLVKADNLDLRIADMRVAMRRAALQEGDDE